MFEILYFNLISIKVKKILMAALKTKCEKKSYSIIKKQRAGLFKNK